MEPETRFSAHPHRLDDVWQRDRQRIEIQSRLIDGGTQRHIEMLGVGRGWRCAEIGAGTGSIATWLARRVAPDGHVVATDLDTRDLEPLAQAGLEVRRHDIVAAPLAPEAFDFVHTRLLLRLLPERATALRHMVASLRPGGVLLAEDFDLGTAGFFHPPSRLQARINTLVERLLARSGVEPRFGIMLFAALRAAGLESVEAEGRLPVVPLGSLAAEVLALKLEAFRARLVQTGRVTESEVDRAIAEARSSDSGTIHYPPLMIAAWGRKPLRAPAQRP